MSVKDTRFKRQCPICSDTLIGTDDGKMVYDCLVEEVKEIEAGTIKGDPCCTLCGEECPLEEAKQIIARGEPTLQKVER